MPTIPVFQNQDLLNAFLQLLPRGKAWPTTNSNMVQALAPLMQQVTDFCNNSAELIVDGFPATTVQILPEWQKSLGLPDPCAGESPLLSQEQAQIVARLVGQGGQSIPYLIQYAANLGYTITITEFTAFTAGHGGAGEPLYDDYWSYALQINSALNTITYFTAGDSQAGEPLAAWGNEVLSCEFARLSPAHSVLIFAYT